MKKIPTAFWMILVLAGLIGIATWQRLPTADVRLTSTPTTDPRDAQTVFRHISPNHILALRIDDPSSDRDLILESNGRGSWRLVGVENPEAIDPVVADNLAKTVAFIPYVEILSPDDTVELVNFGLTPETFWLQIQVILTTMEIRNIVVGRLVPGSQNGYYALVDDRNEIYILNRGAVEFLAAYLRQIQPLLTA